MSDVRGFYAELGIDLTASPSGRTDAQARCFIAPAEHRHGDRTPSCSVNLEHGAFKCFGCQRQGGAYDAAVAVGRSPAEAMQLLERFGLKGPEEQRSEPTPRAAKPYRKPAGGIEYRYVDESNRLLFGVCRTPDKRFFAFSPANDDPRELVFGMNGARPVLYRLPLVRSGVRNGYPIWVAEGEKDVHALESAGVIATCNPGGAGKWRDEYAEALRGAAVTVVADRDDPGRKHAAKVAESLRRVARSVRVVEPAEGKDAFDHLAAGLGEHEFVEVVPQPVASGGGLQLVNPHSVQERDTEWLLKHWVMAHTLNIIQGHGGTNKGTWTCWLGAQASRGELTDSPMTVLYASAEDSHATVLKPRLMAAGANLDYVRFVPELSLPEDVENGRLQEAIRSAGAGLLVIDPLVTFLGQIDTWKDQSVKHALTPILNMADEERCTIIAVHHLTKSTEKGALLSGNGSGAFGNTARLVMAMVKDPEREDERILEVVKSNGGPVGVGKQFKVELVSVEGLKESHVTLVEAGGARMSADEALAAARTREKVPKERLQERILECLESGAQSRKSLDAIGKDEFALSPDSVWKCGLNPLKKAGRIGVRKVGMEGHWEWFLT